MGVTITMSDHILNSYQVPASGVHSQRTVRESAWAQALSRFHLPKWVPIRIAGGNTVDTWCLPGRGRGNRDPDRAVAPNGPGVRGRTPDRRVAALLGLSGWILTTNLLFGDPGAAQSCPAA